MKILLTFVFFTTLIIFKAGAGPIKIRMAEAYNSGTPVISSQLKDVVPLLKKSFSFNCYTLLGSKSVSTPVNRRISLNGYQLLCKGDDNRMQVTVYHDKKSILKSSVIFRKGKPVIIGGFKGAKGKIFFVFTK